MNRRTRPIDELQLLIADFKTVDDDRLTQRAVRTLATLLCGYDDPEQAAP